MRRVLPIAIVAIALGVPARAQLTFSGLVLYSSTANGAQSGGFWWETTGGNVANVYMFTGSTGSPNPFLNGGNTDGSLNANYSLSVGTHTISFAGDTVPGTSDIGLNFYFDGDLANNRISATVPTDGSTSFSVISGGTSTYGQAGLNTSSGTLSFTSGGLTATLTDLHTFTGGPFDLVSYTAIGANSTPDIVGHFTLTVTAVPEPATVGLWVGAVALVAAGVWRKKVARLEIRAERMVQCLR